MSLARLLVTMLGMCSKNDGMLEDFKETVIHFTGNHVSIYENVRVQKIRRVS